ncbi:MAG: flippase-like domain-containing protein [Pyrinomonadaceae bacterium]|nr:flippase-like domain-containing protein [Pyrinomonadaceae bacterium]MCX7640285.1 flippase-like domain-containing protein [Pyrinomonadaceae bacterium]MDW8305267.1 lysylphosphatidylglycerol synthase domain-containing protein [Acidobacteriota bacterium]
MNSKFKEEKTAKTENKTRRLRIIGFSLTLCGILLFSYFVWSVGIYEILEGIGKIGLDGFAVIISIYFLRIMVRSIAWKLSVFEPYKLQLRDTLPAVIIGEAMSSMIPLGILVSGTSKAIAVRHRVPLIIGLSSVATENLFYSFMTAFFVACGAIAFVRSFELSEGWYLTLDLLIVLTFSIMIFLVLMVIRQWHFLSGLCEWLYRKGILRQYMESGRIHARFFENLVYGYYRQYPKYLLPILFLQGCFHLLGVLEIAFILFRLTGELSFYTAFLLESVSRLITVVFKLVPFLIGIDEAGAQFVTEVLSLGAGLGVTVAIIRKGRIFFWAMIGVLLIVKRGLTIKEIFSQAKKLQTATD